MKFKAVVFDMDGTLLDTLEDLADSMNRVLERHGFSAHPVDAYRDFVGSGATRLVARTLPPERQDESLVRHYLKEFLDEYEQGWKIKTRLYDGVADLLDNLVARDVPMAVLTNKPQDFADLCMAEFLSSWPFALTLGQRTGVPVKPDPTMPGQVVRHLHVRPEEILYLGDTDVDMKTACNAGMFPVGVLWGFRGREELLRSGARKLLEHPMELLRCLE